MCSSSASDSESDGSDSTSVVNFFSLAKQFSLDMSLWFKKCITVQYFMQLSYQLVSLSVFVAVSHIVW